MAVEQVFIHELYNAKEMSNDIALVKFSKPVKLSKKRKTVRTICLPVDETHEIEQKLEDNKVFSIAGWGTEENQSSSNDILRHNSISYIPQDMCKTYLESQNSTSILGDSQFCAGGLDGTNL